PGVPAANRQAERGVRKRTDDGDFRRDQGRGARQSRPGRARAYARLRDDRRNEPLARSAKAPVLPGTGAHIRRYHPPVPAEVRQVDKRTAPQKRRPPHEAGLRSTVETSSDDVTLWMPRAP